MIEARGLVKRYGATAAVNDLSFTIRPAPADPGLVRPVARRPGFVQPGFVQPGLVLSRRQRQVGRHGLVAAQQPGPHRPAGEQVLQLPGQAGAADDFDPVE